MEFDEYGNRKKKRRKLLDIDVTEISLVDLAATGNKFLITKRGEKMELDEILKAFLGPEDLDEINELAKDLPEETKTEILDALKVLDEYLEALPGDATDGLRELVKLAVIVAERGPSEASDAVLEECLKDLEKYLEDFNPAIVEAVETLKRLAAEGIEGQEYEQPKKEAEKDKEDKVKKSGRLLWPSFFATGSQIAKGAFGQLSFVGDPIFKDEEEEEDEDIKKRTEKKRKRSLRKSIEGQDGDEDLEGDERLWPSLSSSEE